MMNFKVNELSSVKHLSVEVERYGLEIRVKRLEVRFNVTDKNPSSRYELNHQRFLLKLEEVNSKTGKRIQKSKYYDSVERQFVGDIPEEKWPAYCRTSEFYKQLRDFMDDLMPEIHLALNDYVDGRRLSPGIKIIKEAMAGYQEKLCLDFLDLNG